MEIQNKISRSQTAYLVYGSAVGNIVYTFTEVTFIAGRSFWVAALIGVLCNIPFAVWILFLGLYTKENGTLFDLIEEGTGRAVCRLIILIYFLINAALSVCMLNLFTGCIKVFFLPRTPAFVIMLIILLMCAIFVNSGLKYFARLIAVLCLLFTVNYFMGFSVSFIKNVKIENITPVFDTSLPQFFKGVAFTAGNEAECLLFLMVISGLIPQTQKHYMSVVKGLFAWSIVLSSAILIMEGIVGNELLSRVGEAGITVSSDIQIGAFFSGLEIFIFITYQYIAIFKTIIYLYCCRVSLEKLFKVRQSKILLIFSALAIFAASVFMNSYNRSFFFSIFLADYIVWPFVIIVLLLGSLSVFIKKQRKGKNAK